MSFRKTATNSFFGNFLYDQVLDKDHFLVRLRHEVEWSDLCTGLMKAYKGGGEYGPSVYAPDLLLRYLLIPYLFGISERETEQLVNVHLLAKYFVGLGVSDAPPDHSTLTVFKRRVAKIKGGRGYATFWDKIFRKVLRQAQGKGIVLGSIQIIDSTHTTADVNLPQERQRKRDGQSPVDPEAKGGVKRVENKNIKTKSGVFVKAVVPVTIYGYKTHTSMNAGTNLVTSFTTTPANENDGKQFIPLVKKDQEVNQNIQAVTADRGYDDGENFLHCQNKGLVPAIAMRKTRTAPVWDELRKIPLYRESLHLRGRIEAKFGEVKTNHSFHRCRYRGLARYHIQATLTLLTANLKRIMLLTETNTRDYCIHPVFVTTS